MAKVGLAKVGFDRCCVVVVWSLSCCCGVVVVLLWCCCGVVVVLLWCCCGVVGLFVCVFVCVFSSFRAFLGSWRPRGGEGQMLMTADGGQITGAGKAYDSGLGANYSGRGSL